MRKQILILLLLAGCLPSLEVAPPVPISQPTVEQATETYFYDYAERFSRASSEVAARAKNGEFRDVTDANDAFIQATKDAREAAEKELRAATNREFQDERGKPGSSLAPILEAKATGAAKVKRGKK